MNPYAPPKLPFNSIDWVRHVTLIGKANAALARDDRRSFHIVYGTD
jgi:hypothetical protein